MESYRNPTLPTPTTEQKKGFELQETYKHAHEELTLQQSKRDQIITVYLALITFIVPFSFSLNGITSLIQGLLFAALAIVGILFSTIVVRYRVYKECYWLACQTLTQLSNYDSKMVNKTLIQQIFYSSIFKKYKKCVNVDKRRICTGILIRRNLFSAETLYFTIQAFVTAILGGLSVVFLYGYVWWQILIAVGVGVAIMLLLFTTYFKNLAQVFATIKYPHDVTDEEAEAANDAFNFAFSKAWFLHFYLDEA